MAQSYRNFLKQIRNGILAETDDIIEAASKIFKQTGYDEQAAMMNKEVTEQFTLLRNNNLIMQGY